MALDRYNKQCTTFDSTKFSEESKLAQDAIPWPVLARPPVSVHLVDWDTVGVAVPERDLWPFADDPEALARYADVSGHVPDPDLLDLYRLRWDLRDVVEFVDLFGAPHRSSPDTERALAELAGVLARLVT